MIILGIDPGLNGGICCFDENFIEAMDIPTHGEGPKRRIDALAVRRFIKAWQPDMAFIERAQAMPKQGSSSGFNYGRAVGALEAAVACSEVPMTIVEPSVWKRALGLPGGAENKESARQRAIQLRPGCSLFERKKDHGRAEAFLIGYYGSQQLLRAA
jgi:crossover junction endodeoxyribonuclease RuvC